MVLTSALLVQERSAGIRRTSIFVWTNVLGWLVIRTEEDSADALATWASSRNGFLAWIYQREVIDAHSITVNAYHRYSFLRLTH